MRETIRVSELAQWLRCRRRTYFSYELGYDSSSREAGIGTAFHTMLKGYHGAPEDITEEEYDQLNSLDPEAAETVQRMFDTYREEVESEGLDVGIETIFVEERFHQQVLEEGLTLTGQIDHVYRDEATGEIVVQDTKTVGSFFETAQRDFQMMTYLWLVIGRFPDHDRFAIEHNIVKRNKRTARSNPPYVQRNRVSVSREEVEKWGQMLVYIVSEYATAMKGAEYSGLGIKSPLIWAKGTNDCSWYCPFSDICGMVDDPEADVLGVLEAEYVKREEEPLNA